MMKEFDCVYLTHPFSKLPVGAKGTIVYEYDGKNFEVEFFDAKGETIGVFTTPASILALDEGT